MSLSRTLPIAWLLLVASLSFACHDFSLSYDHAPGEIVLYDDLYSISVVDDDHAVAVGYYGAAYYTEDGGASWKAGETNTLTPIYDVAMATVDKGWAVGQLGLILRTEDGGRTWTRQPNLKEEEGSHLFAVTTYDEKTALAVGTWGTRLFTNDGGRTWQDRSFIVTETHPMFVWLSPFEKEKVQRGEKVYEDVGLNDVYCLGAPSKNCWLVGEFGYIYYSDDLGETWVPAAIEGSAELEQIKVGYNKIAMPEEVVPELDTFVASIRDQAHLNVAIEGVASAREIQEMGRSDDPMELFEVIEGRAQEVRTILEDAGLPSERVRVRGSPPWDYEDYLDDDPDFLERYFRGRLADDPGVKVRVIQNPILFTVRFRDAQNGLIAGLGGVILRTEDGGKSWAYRETDRQQALFAVGSVPGRAVAVGEKGFVRVSTDDGDSWQSLPRERFPTVYTYLRDVAFDPSGKMGFIVGQTGRILRSIDAGIRWEQVLPPPNEERT